MITYDFSRSRVGSTSSDISTPLNVLGCMGFAEDCGFVRPPYQELSSTRARCARARGIACCCRANLIPDFRTSQSDGWLRLLAVLPRARRSYVGPRAS